MYDTLKLWAYSVPGLFEWYKENDLYYAITTLHITDDLHTYTHIHAYIHTYIQRGNDLYYAITTLHHHR